MRRTLLLLVGVLLSGMALGSDSPKEYDDATQIDGLEGTWQAVSVENLGELVFSDSSRSGTLDLPRWEVYMDGAGA